MQDQLRERCVLCIDRGRTPIFPAKLRWPGQSFRAKLRKLGQIFGKINFTLYIGTVRITVYINTFLDTNLLSVESF